MPDEDKIPRLYSLPEAADELANISVWSIRKHIYKGNIHVVRLGRTRFEQRHIDQCRRRMYENDFPRRPDVPNDHGERSESIVGFGPGGAIYDRIDPWENIPDPRSGLCGLGGTGDDTELIFQQPVALVQWTDKYQRLGLPA